MHQMISFNIKLYLTSLKSHIFKKKSIKYFTKYLIMISNDFICNQSIQKQRDNMAVKRIILTLDSETEIKVRKKAKELEHSTVQRYIYDLIRNDLLKDKKIPMQISSNDSLFSHSVDSNKQEYSSQTKNSEHMKTNDIIGNHRNMGPISKDALTPALSPQNPQNQPVPQEQKKKLPSELILEHLEKETNAKETIERLKNLGN